MVEPETLRPWSLARTLKEVHKDGVIAPAHITNPDLKPSFREDL